MKNRSSIILGCAVALAFLAASCSAEPSATEPTTTTFPVVPGCMSIAGPSGFNSVLTQGLLGKDTSTVWLGTSTCQSAAKYSAGMIYVAGPPASTQGLAYNYCLSMYGPTAAIWYLPLYGEWLCSPVSF
jgi:hypothetical protein